MELDLSDWKKLSMKTKLASTKLARLSKHLKDMSIENTPAETQSHFAILISRKYTRPNTGAFCKNLC